MIQRNTASACLEISKMRFAYTNATGGISIVYPAKKVDLERLFGPLSEEDYRAHVIERSCPAAAADWTELPDDLELPDRAFRSAWRLRDGNVIIDQTLIKS